MQKPHIILFKPQNIHIFYVCSLTCPKGGHNASGNLKLTPYLLFGIDVSEIYGNKDQNHFSNVVVSLTLSVGSPSYQVCNLIFVCIPVYE